MQLSCPLLPDWIARARSSFLGYLHHDRAGASVDRVHRRIRRPAASRDDQQTSRRLACLLLVRERCELKIELMSSRDHLRSRGETSDYGEMKGAGERQATCVKSE